MYIYYCAILFGFIFYFNLGVHRLAVHSTRFPSTQ